MEKRPKRVGRAPYCHTGAVANTGKDNPSFLSLSCAHLFSHSLERATRDEQIQDNHHSGEVDETAGQNSPLIRLM